MKQFPLCSLVGVTIALAACDQRPSFEPVCETTASDSTKAEVVAVIGDGYSEADEGVFQANVRDLVCNALFKDPAYAAHRDRFSVLAARHVSTISKVRNTEEDTAFKTVFNGSPALCNFTESAQSVKLIQEAVRGVRGLRSVILLAHADGAGGYANGDLIYIASRSTTNITPHEYGHRAGLYDENIVVDVPYEGAENLERANCSTDCNPHTVWWRRAVEEFPEKIGAFPGCLYHLGKICRPSEQCRMRAPAESFSVVCRGLVAEYLEHGNVARPNVDVPLDASRGADSFIAGDYHQIVVSVPSTTALPVFSTSEQSGGFRPQVRPMSDTFYAVSVNDKVLFAESVRMQSSRTRCYPAIDSKPTHEGESGGGTFFVSRVPKNALRTIDPETLQLRLYQVAQGVRLNAITAEAVQSLILGGMAIPMTPAIVIFAP